MMMCVDQTGENDMCIEIEDFIGLLGKFVSRTNLLDPAVLSVKTSIGDLAPLTIHRDQKHGITDQ